MAFLIKLCLFVVLVHALLLLPNSVLGDSDDEDTLLHGLNSYRQSMKLPALVKNGKADCLADQIVGDMEDKPCMPVSAAPTAQITQSPDYPKHLKKCKIDAKSTADGLILPVCVPKLVPTLVLRNYINISYAKYLGNASYTGAGLGSEDDWMVLVLTTTAPTGMFSGAVSLVYSRMASAWSLVSCLVLVFSSLLVLS